MTRISRRLVAPVVAGLIASFAVVATSAPAGASTVVRAGQSIQAAIDAAAPGDTIVVFRGTYEENLTIDKDGIRLIGLGATLVPPASPTQNVCGDPENPEATSGVCIHGDVTFGDEGPVVNSYVHDVTVQGFTVTGFGGIGIFAIGADGTSIRANKALDNVDYGIFANLSTHTRIVFNKTTNSEEAGIYVGDSPNADATVIANESSGSLFGIFVRNAEQGAIIGNRLHDNCVGTVFLGDAPGPAGAFSVHGNFVKNNNKFCEANEEEETPALSGIGFAIVGAHDVDIQGNIVTGNVPSGPVDFSGGVVVIQDGPTPPSANTVAHNIIVGNEPDLFWDGSGTDNTFARNLCHTSVPNELCS